MDGSGKKGKITANARATVPAREKPGFFSIHKMQKTVREGSRFLDCVPVKTKAGCSYEYANEFVKKSFQLTAFTKASNPAHAGGRQGTDLLNGLRRRKKSQTRFIYKNVLVMKAQINMPFTGCWVRTFTGKLIFNNL